MPLCKTESMGGSTKGAPLHFFFHVSALQGEESFMSVISWRSGRIDRASRGATCAEMLGNSAMENSPNEMARLILGACVTDRKGLNDKMQDTGDYTKR